MTSGGSFRKSLLMIGEGRFLLYASLLERAFFFIFFLMLAKKYPVEEYGLLVTGFTIANVSAIIFDLGIPIHVQKEISSGRDPRHIFPPVVSLNALLLPVFFAVSLITGYFMYGIPVITMLLISVPVFLFSVSNLLNKALAGKGDFRNQYMALLFSRVPMLAAVSVMFFLQISIDNLLFILAAGALLQMIILVHRLRADEMLSDFSALSFLRIRNLYSILPLGAAVAFNFLYDKIDILILSRMLGFHESGIYSVSYGLYKTATLTFSFLLIPALTKISAVSRRSSAVRLVLAKYTWMIFLICIFTTGAMILAAGPVVNLLYGEKFAESAVYVRILSAAFVGIGLNNLFGVALNGLGLYRQNLYVTFTALVVNVGMNFMLIPSMGILGAVIATVATEYLVLALDSHYISRYLIQTN